MNTPHRLISIRANLGGEIEGETRNMALMGSCFGYCVDEFRLKRDRGPGHRGTMKMNNKFAIFSLPFICTLGLSALAIADVTIEQTFNVDAAGALSMAAMKGTTVTSIARDKSRTDNELKFKSGLMRTFAGRVGNTTSIVRLDEERIINVDYEKKRYTEVTFAEMRLQTEQALQQMEEMRESEEHEQTGSTALPVTEQNCEWTDATVETSQSGEKQKIAGLKAEQSVITATQTCRDPETGKACNLTWTLEQWLAPTAPGGDEVQAFWKNYARKLGFDELVGQAGMPSMTQLLSQYQQGWEEIENQSGELQGYPLRTIMQLEVGGDECTTADDEPISYENVFGDAMTEAAGDAAAESIGDAAGGAIGGVIAKGLFSTFGKKKKAKQEAAVEPVTGSVRLFRFEVETTKIRTKAVRAEHFEIPAGFTRVE